MSNPNDGNSEIKKSYEEQKKYRQEALHSDFQSHRFIFENSTQESQIKSAEGFQFEYLYKPEMVGSDFNKSNQNQSNQNQSNQNKSPQDQLIYYVKRMNDKLKAIKTIGPDNFDNFMALVVMLKQIRTTALSCKYPHDDQKKKETDKFFCNLVVNTETPINKLLEDMSKESDSDKLTTILYYYSNRLLDQKYINSYTVPILIYNDSNIKYPNFYLDEYVRLLSQKIYFIFIVKAYFHLHPEENNETSYQSFLENYVNKVDGFDKLASSKIENETEKDKEDKPKPPSSTQNDASGFAKNECKSGYSKDFINFLDYSPILSENCIRFKSYEKNGVTYEFKNLSNDISKKLIDYFSKDIERLIKCFEKVKSSNNNISHLVILERASELIEILKISNALLHENGAEIPPLSFIWKRIDNFKSKLKDTVFQLINKFIINASYNFATHSFALSTAAEYSSVIMNVFEFKNEDKPTIFCWATHKYNDNRIHSNKFDIDSVASIASLIGEKQLNLILYQFIEQLKVITEKFCQAYRNYIVNFNFKIDFHKESQSLHSIKEYFDSFVRYFNLADSNDVVKLISNIGNIVALIILFDSAKTTEFITKDLISSSIKDYKHQKKNDYEKYFNRSFFGYQNHNLFHEAVKLMGSILNEQKNRSIFEEINHHSAFYQFALTLIYASSHKTFLLELYSDNVPQTNQLFNLADSISITCSIFLEILSQYDLYAYSNILRAFLSFNENGISDDMNEDNDEYINSYKPKLKSNIEIVDLFHYSMAGFSFPYSNHLIICQNENEVHKMIQTIKKLVNRCDQVALLACGKCARLFNKKVEKENNMIEEEEEENEEEDKTKDEKINPKIDLPMMIEIIGLVEFSNQKTDEKCSSTHQPDKKKSKFIEYPNIDWLKKLGCNDFTLAIFQKKHFLNPNKKIIEIDNEFLSNLNQNFPCTIKNDNYLVPKKGRNPMTYNSSLNNFILSETVGNILTETNPQ